MNLNFWRLCWISFFSDVSSELLYPILPIFLTLTLGASAGAVGLIEGMAELAASLLKARVGIWSDRAGRRKPFIGGGYALAVISKGTIALASSWIWVCLARVMDRVGKGIRTAPRDAMITELVPKEKLGKAFGIHRMMDTAGAVVGPLIAVALLSQGNEDYRKYFLYSLIPGTGAILLTLFLTESGARPTEPEKILPKLEFKTLPKKYHQFLWAWGAFAISNSSDAFILLKMKASGLSMVTLVLVYAGFNLVYALFSGVIGSWSDRVGQRLVLKLSLICFAVAYLAFGFAHSWVHYVICYSIYGVYMAMSDGVGKAWIGQLVPTTAQGTAQGYFGLVNGLCAFGASLIAGLLWDHVGPMAPFIYAAVGAVAGLIVFSLQE